jgi:hypothetical protein
LSDDFRRIPDCKVSVAGKKLEGVKDAALAKVDVDLDGDLFGQCVLTFHDPHLKLINSNEFAAGTAIKVEIGFHTKLKTVFEGEVVGLEPQFRRDLPPALKVVCQESIHRLALQQMTRAFNNVDDKEVVTRIAREHGLSAEAPSGSKEHILQSNVSDAVFLRRLAQKRGNHVRIEGKKLIVAPPPRGRNVMVRPGSAVKKIKVKIKAGHQLSEVAVHGWDPKTKKEFKGTARGEGVVGQGARDFGGRASLAIASHEVPPSDVATAESMAKGRMRKLAEGFTTAQVEMVGNPDVVPGGMVDMDKMGDRIDGVWRVERAHHEFSKHGYWVSFRATRISKKSAASASAQRASQRAGAQAQAEARDRQAQMAAAARAQGGTEKQRIDHRIEVLEEPPHHELRLEVTEPVHLEASVAVVAPGKS